MRFSDWKNEQAHHNSHLNNLRGVTYRTFAIREAKPDGSWTMAGETKCEIVANAYVIVDGTFQLTLYGKYGQMYDLGQLSREELIEVLAAHTQMSDWIEGRRDKPPGFPA